MTNEEKIEKIESFVLYNGMLHYNEQKSYHTKFCASKSHGNKGKKHQSQKTRSNRRKASQKASRK